MYLPKLVTKIRPGQAVRRGHDQDPTLRYRIASNEADLRAIVASEPALKKAKIKPEDQFGYPLLVEIWDGGSAWSSQLPLSSALADDWEAV